MPTFRSLLKNWLSLLLIDVFRDFLRNYEQEREAYERGFEGRIWTKRRCPHCKHPYAFQDAMYCAFCGVALQSTEPALCVLLSAQPYEQSTDALATVHARRTLYVPPGTLRRAVQEERRNGHGVHTSIMEAIQKVQEKQL